jgi:CDP-diacylglycerol--glycerol-3-phosphate 3-phosphatidyltransferase
MPNIANRITIFRILLIPVFMAFLLGRLPWGDWLAVAVFTVAAVTDSVDGYLARKHNQITIFGQFFDPLADKLLISAALVTLVDLNRLSAWIVMVILTREFAISGLRLMAVVKGVVVPASPLGKTKTITQVLAVIAWILKPAVVPEVLAVALMGLAVVVTVVSGIDYYIKVKPSLEAPEVPLDVTVPSGRVSHDEKGM